MDKRISKIKHYPTNEFEQVELINVIAMFYVNGVFMLFFCAPLGISSPGVKWRWYQDLKCTYEGVGEIYSCKKHLYASLVNKYIQPGWKHNTVY